MKKYPVFLILFFFVLCKEESKNPTQVEDPNMAKKQQVQVEEKKSRFVMPSGIYVMNDAIEMSSFLSAKIPDSQSYCMEIDLEKMKATAKFRTFKKQYTMEIEDLGEGKYSIVYEGKKREFEFQEDKFRGIIGYDIFFYDRTKKNEKGAWIGGNESGRLSTMHQNVIECDKYYEEHYRGLEGVNSEEQMPSNYNR
ncbi:hypothetical protein [Leptospira noguchii]|uniref:hypothetical protein n=1 Tax=Leptospira noguchii TaxID=28182 RepID=UPI0011476FED|nr:hypothetical protein [Leptospira noguchii]TQE66225.1 hypothetical protein FF021_18790 [Leptospira noguchii]UOG54969.1 hypothetical protein MAL09_21850 [Leptospira noguchii]